MEIDCAFPLSLIVGMITYILNSMLPSSASFLNSQTQVLSLAFELMPYVALRTRTKG